jgi:hypothetical protein
MSATITWGIEYMQCKPTEGSYIDVVITAGWRCQGVETVNNLGAGASVCGTASFPIPEGSFTPYADLTQDQVLGWCWANGVDKFAVELSVQQQIDNQINPPVVQTPLPWIAPPVTE